jgi:hypothetical protein
MNTDDQRLERAIRGALGDLVAAAPRRDEVPVQTAPPRPLARRTPWLALAAGLTAAAGIVAVVLVSTRATITTDVSRPSVTVASTAPATTAATTTSPSTTTTTTSPTTTTAAPTPGPLQRVEFPRGTNNTSVSRELAPRTADRFVLEAAASQTMIVHLAAAAGTTFSIIAPDGTPLAEDEELAAVELPADGDYVVVVGTAGSGGDYTIDFLIN